MSAADRMLVVESATLLVVAAVALSIASFVRVRRLLHLFSRIRFAPAASNTARVAWAVTTAARYAPVRSTCLVDSLVAEMMLMRRGKPCTLRLGVRTHGAHGPLDAHAWIECDGSVVVGAVERLSDYAVLAEPVPRHP